jgi:hypothetical protein
MREALTNVGNTKPCKSQVWALALDADGVPIPGRCGICQQPKSSHQRNGRRDSDSVFNEFQEEDFNLLSVEQKLWMAEADSNHYFNYHTSAGIRVCLVPNCRVVLRWTTVSGPWLRKRNRPHNFDRFYR